MEAELGDQIKGKVNKNIGEAKDALKKGVDATLAAKHG